MKSAIIILINCLKYVFVLWVTLFFSFCSSTDPNIKVMDDYIKLNIEPGSYLEVKKLENWAKGSRYEIATNTGNYMFYLQESEVVGVWKILESGEREQIFKKIESNPDLSGIGESTNVSEVPTYRILEKVELFSGKGIYGDILIPELSKDSEISEVESILRTIMKKESLISIAGYSTEDAFKANYSESYSKSNPKAMENGFLGMIDENGLFIK